MSAIPLLTLEGLAHLREANDSPGQLPKSWAALTCEVARRLGSSRPWVRTRRCVHATRAHFVTFEIDRTGLVTIAFGSLGRDGKRITVGELVAQWDALGLTGPYRMLLRGRSFPLPTFHAALEPYLSLPTASHKPT